MSVFVTTSIPVDGSFFHSSLSLSGMHLAIVELFILFEPKAPAAKVAPASSITKMTTPDTEKLVKDAIKNSIKDAVKTQSIPTPSEVKGVILSPENTPKVSPELKTPVK